MKKLLITGASGFLGWNLSHIAKREGWEVYGTIFNHFIEIPKITTVKVDLRDDRAVKDILNEIQPIAIVHTAARSSPNFCQNYPDESYAINVTASVRLARLCADCNIQYVFTSTDLVFDGLNPPYQESDPVSPINRYGEQKAIAEQKILEVYPQSAICRMPLMFGMAPPTSSSFIQPWLKSLREGKELSLFVDELRTPASASTAARGLLLAVGKRVSGILHLGGKERISRYHFGLLMARTLQLPEEKIKACQQKDVPMAAPRAADVSLDSSKAFALGYQPLSLQDEFTALYNKI
jgi:dTDP-4-dehydrorhamnose reductase